MYVILLCIGMRCSFNELMMFSLISISDGGGGLSGLLAFSASLLAMVTMVESGLFRLAEVW